MAPGYLYYAALAFIVAPSMWVNRMAVLVVGVWVVGQLVWLTGADPSSADMVLDIVSIGVGMAYARSAVDYFVVALFVPMAALNMASGMQTIHPYYAWWLLFDMAMAQALVIPFGNDWQHVGKLLSRLYRWKAVRDVA